jgi:hypothetical protein
VKGMFLANVLLGKIISGKGVRRDLMYGRQDEIEGHCSIEASQNIGLL